ncbi:hypothetical protein IWQ62_000848 [Dispira parvispora]|uniref:Uncharacterized protein n=1 Tax=Dispira parvispora TaxID=1520584 RepID=A0A9W8E9R0_9FUNG|nr:hypothetical protein IWQ62_000848 [Dispira parvispora]
MDLYIVVYSSIQPEYQHVALFRSSDKRFGSMYEVTGASGFFRFCNSHVDMDTIEDIEALHLVKQGCPDIQIHTQDVFVNNSDLKWNCQFWVSDALELLRNRGILNDREYNQGVDVLWPIISQWYGS